MATGRSHSSTPPVLRCSHCGRPVRETSHTRNSFQVDYYVLHTGDVEPCVIIVEDEDSPVTFQRLVSPLLVITCADCYQDPEVQRERERLFRPEAFTETDHG